MRIISPAIDMEWLLVSSPRGLERHAVGELKHLMKEAGIMINEINLKVVRLPIIGLSLISIDASARDVIQRLKQYAIENPWDFRLVSKVKPLEHLLDTDLKLIHETVEKLMVRIPLEATFRIQLERRMTDIDRDRLIIETAEKIERKVDLTHPDWIVLIEVLRERTGISVIKPTDILSLAEIRRGDITP